MSCVAAIKKIIISNSKNRKRRGEANSIYLSIYLSLYMYIYIYICKKMNYMLVGHGGYIEAFESPVSLSRVRARGGREGGFQAIRLV